MHVDKPEWDQAGNLRCSYPNIPVIASLPVMQIYIKTTVKKISS